MGEKSKATGDFGEDAVSKLLNLIGWISLVKNFEISCYAPDEHQLSSKPRKNHGIDISFRYSNPLYDDTEDLILISSKYNEFYPDNPNSKFKSHLRDVAEALYCFKRGKQYSINPEKKFFQKNFVGVIFWLCDKAPYNDLVDKLKKMRFKNEIKTDFEYIYLVDNKRANFLFKSITHINHEYNYMDVNFLYFDTGYNNTARGRETHGKILPVQYINSNIIPFKLIHAKTNDEYLLICLNEPFSPENFTSLLNLSHKLSEGWGQEIILLFQKFDSRQDPNTVTMIKQTFLDSNFANKVSAGSFDPDFRNLV